MRDPGLPDHAIGTNVRRDRAWDALLPTLGNVGRFPTLESACRPTVATAADGTLSA